MAKYRVQGKDGVETIDEAKLRKRLRSNKLSGLELVRREDHESWVPLCETELFRDEVPFRGHPLDAARGRQVQGFLGHLSGWTITAAIMGALGSWFPFWLWIWGVFLVVHAVKVAPAALGLLESGRLFGAASRVGISEGTERQAVAASVLDSSPLVDEVAQVRALLAQRGGEEDARLAREVERLASTLSEVAHRRADLDTQLSPDELRELDEAREETEHRLRSANTEQDRDLLRQELEAVAQRREAVERAQRTLERLQTQERVARHQLKLLRLDLSQAEASMVDVPNLADRVEAIRRDAMAIEEVEEALAGSRQTGRAHLRQGSTS